MALHQRDYILRLIERVAAALARVRKRREDGDHAGARREVAETTVELLGPSAPMIPLVDSTTAANLLSDPQRIALYSRLLETDADLLAAMGQGTAATAARRRALELLLELVLRRTELPEETADQLRALLAIVDVTQLGPRYQQAKATL
ncbi:MAG: hypothetical protein ACT4P7_03230 [Gemmatimonadaceae bacterium]